MGMKEVFEMCKGTGEITEIGDSMCDKWGGEVKSGEGGGERKLKLLSRKCRESVGVWIWW
jgi:hypothetical protein